MYTVWNYRYYSAKTELMVKYTVKLNPRTEAFDKLKFVLLWGPLFEIHRKIWVFV